MQRATAEGQAGQPHGKVGRQEFNSTPKVRAVDLDKESGSTTVQRMKKAGWTGNTGEEMVAVSRQAEWVQWAMAKSQIV